MLLQRTLTAKLAAAVLGISMLGGCATLSEEDQARLDSALNAADRAEGAAQRAEAAAASAENSAARAAEAYNRMLEKP